MSTSYKVRTLTTAAMLCAIGILIPLVSPLKIIIPPASFTLASHVAIMIAMFISPVVGISVALVTCLGFFIHGFPLVVVLRALSHIIFVALGAVILKRFPKTLNSFKTMIPFALLIAIVHAIAEVFVSSLFYFQGTVTKSYLISVIGLVGIGTIIHSLVDFSIAVLVWIPVQRVVNIPTSARIKLGAK
jgi:niacin transporter